MSSLPIHETILAATGQIKADLIIRNAQFLDVFNGEFVQGDIALYKGQIVATGGQYEADKSIDASGQYLIPGFIDAHVHLESSMLTPARYEELVLPLGTTTVIWDPHEIANALGLPGLDWALSASDNLRLSIYIMIPSCVPATTPQLGLETSGFTLTAEMIAPYKSHPRVLGLAEMMNIPGLMFGDPDVHAKIESFRDKMIDGHCPHVSYTELVACIASGIKSCHETTEISEARLKLQNGMALFIREGSCAKNSKELFPLINAYNSMRIALCSDDLNPLDIKERGHINFMVNEALKSGIAPEQIFRVASFSAAQIYGLKDRGAIAPGYTADLLLVTPKSDNNFRSGIEILQVFKKGEPLLTSNKISASQHRPRPSTARNINLNAVKSQDFAVLSQSDTNKLHVIGVIPQQIITQHLCENMRTIAGNIPADPARDLLKIAVLERYKLSGSKSVGFVKGFGLKKGAIAASISHDSHNVVVIGCDEESMATAVNKLRKIDGGIVVVCDEQEIYELALPIAGLQSDAPCDEVIDAMRKLKWACKKMGSPLEEPFLQMAFLALPVIPDLKLTDKGLVDVTKFKLINLVQDS